jgi:hypothetical protein
MSGDKAYPVKIMKVTGEVVIFIFSYFDVSSRGPFIRALPQKGGNISLCCQLEKK